MRTIEPLRKMFYIMDNSENLYRLDKDGQLVVAVGKEDAVFFTYEEADKKIGKGKRSHYYKIVPTEMHSETGIQDHFNSTVNTETLKFDEIELADLYQRSTGCCTSRTSATLWQISETTKSNSVLPNQSRTRPSLTFSISLSSMI